jgi:hypothetical protein
MNHITLVRVMTDANVPISTATDAGSIQVSWCPAITNISKLPARPASIPSRKDSHPTSRPATKARAKALAVRSVVAIEMADY